MLGPMLRSTLGLLVLLAAPRRDSMSWRRSTLRTSAPLPMAPPSAKFSTLITRSAANSSVSFSLPLVISLLGPPITPSTSKGLAAAAIGTALSFTVEPPSSKLDW